MRIDLLETYLLQLKEDLETNGADLTKVTNAQLIHTIWTDTVAIFERGEKRTELKDKNEKKNAIFH